MGTATDGENTIWIYVRAEGGRLTDIRFRALACSSCVAAASMLTVLAVGRTLHAARLIDGPRLLLALDGLPPDKTPCADLAARALARALDAARA